MEASTEQIQIRSNLHPGDIGELVRLHGTLYAQEYGWDYTFEGYVAASFGEFVLSADRSMDRSAPNCSCPSRQCADERLADPER